MKKWWIMGIVLIIIIIMILYFPFKKDSLQNLELRDCSRIPSEIIKCPNNHFCYEDLSGGLGPDGPLPIESIGGDKRCHKICVDDGDCTQETPFCLKKTICIQDTCEDFYGCFSEKDKP